ncbi:HAD-IIB family hydrolase [Geopsychrobacter electrodiphilus]|uniref:HAD-IIB family hydrolase n=1 Tax=Geopsychrobacter electrodiphilus TaxID=225196 RepID=UPI00037CA815|nr:HAD-IIB family hydrolase [Geopsychrobacter electrodiphilus]
MKHNILLCSDLDRTLLPNGAQPESPEARRLLQRLADRPELTLVYVSGRHQALLQQAIEEYALPRPDYAIGDVGTTIFDIEDGNWRPWDNWYEEIASDWRGKTGKDLQGLFADIELLRLQEPEKQNDFKLSYYAPTDVEPDNLLKQLRQRLDAQEVRASLIWSIDEVADTGLLDILPERATKLHAIEFLMKHHGFTHEQTVFAGDSGNDLPALTSGLQAVLVKNARDDVRDTALRQVQAAGHGDCLYLAQGGLLGMNGNYSAGVLEGLVHYLPHTLAWLQDASIGKV